MSLINMAQEVRGSFTLAKTIVILVILSGNISHAFPYEVKNTSCSKTIGDAMLTCRDDVIYSYRDNLTDSRCCHFIFFRECLILNSKQVCGLSTGIVVNNTLVDYFPIDWPTCQKYEGSYVCIFYETWFNSLALFFGWFFMPPLAMVCSFSFIKYIRYLLGITFWEDLVTNSPVARLHSKLQNYYFIDRRPIAFILNWQVKLPWLNDIY